jgi:hypothetical protein
VTDKPARRTVTAADRIGDLLDAAKKREARSKAREDKAEAEFNAAATQHDADLREVAAWEKAKAELAPTPSPTSSGHPQTVPGGAE